MTYLALCRIETEPGQWENALPCPYCAAAADLHIVRHFEPDETGEAIEVGQRVHCDTCGAAGPFEDDGLAAVTAWNTRYLYQDSDDAPATLPDC